MAPEQILNQAVDARTDLYAFGIMLYQMVTGRLPFESSANGGEFEIMEKQVRHDPIPPQQVHASIPTALSELIMRLLAKNKESRPEDCASVQRRLLEILQQFERARSHATQIIHPPVIQPKQTSGEIAKGLLRAWTRELRRALIIDGGRLLRLWLRDKPTACYRNAMASQSVQGLPERLSAQVHRLQASARGHGYWLGSGLAVALLFVGWLLFSIMDTVEGPAPRPTAVIVADAVKAPVSPAVSEVAGTAPPASAKPAPSQAAAVLPPLPKPAPAKPKPPPRPAPKPQASRPSPTPVTYRVSYKVVNSQFDAIDPHKPNEFRGGSRLYFASLKDNRTDKYRAYQRGWVRLYFRQPVHLSSIHIHKIRITQGDFRGGWIQLAVQDNRGHWTVLLRRHNMDIDKTLVIHGHAAAMARVKSVRLRFRSPEPLMVGPVDLLP
jgi:hypothetical protein